MRGRGVVDVRRRGAAGSQLGQLRICDGREDDLVDGRQLRDDGQQAVLDGCGFECREQDDERALRGAFPDGADDPRPVRLDQGGLERGQRFGHRRHQAWPGRAGDASAKPPVKGDQLDPVTRVRGQCGEQQGGLDARIQTWCVADPDGRGPRGVEHHEHPSVALGSPGPHHDLRAARGRAPVDRPHVVPDDVLAQRVELGAGAPDLNGGPAVELAQPGQAARQVPAGGELGQHPQPARDRQRRLTAGEAHRPPGPDRDHVRRPVTATGGHQDGADPLTVAGANLELVPVRDGAGRRLPCVPQGATQGSSAEVRHRK